MTEHQRATPAAAEAASKLDRFYFTGHPGTSHRVRRIIPGETGDIDPTATHVVVTVIAPGIRHKQFLREYEDLGEGEAPSDSPSVGIL